MKRQTIVEYAEASPEARNIYDEITRVMRAPDVPNFLKALGTNENVLRATWAKLRYTVLTGDVPALLKQLILFNISFRAGNHYCTALHGHAALSLDETLTCEDLMNMTRGEAIEQLPPSYQIAIETVTQAALEPSRLVAEDFDFEQRLRDEGYVDREIDELLAQADFAVMMNTITSIFDIPAERPFPPVDDCAPEGRIGEGSYDPAARAN